MKQIRIAAYDVPGLNTISDDGIESNGKCSIDGPYGNYLKVQNRAAFQK